MILVNGAAQAHVSAADRGLQYGDGVFRTLRANAGEPRHWNRHYRKLAADCAALRIRAPDARVLRLDVERVCREARDCAVKIVVTRGVSERGYAYSRDIEATRIVASAPLPEHPDEYLRDGVRVRLCALRLAPQPALAGVKHLNRLENVLARAEWDDARIAEGLLLDADGSAVCGTRTNLFVVRAGALATPRLDRCGVAGVTRDRIIEAAARHDVPCHVTTLTWDDVTAGDEVVLTNSLVGAWPVCDLNGARRTPGRMARAMQRWLEEDTDAHAL